MKKYRKISDLINGNEHDDLLAVAKHSKEIGKNYDKRVEDNLKNSAKLKLDKKMALKDIKDQDKMNYIYYEYCLGNITIVCEEIKKYDEFTFFHDLVIFLSFGISQEKERTKVYREIVDFYINQLTIIENEEKKQIEKTDSFPIIFETFNKISNWEISQFTQKEPSCFNGRVSIKKYRITIEQVEEPREIYVKRLQELWDNCDNHHHWTPLREVAKELNIELSFETIKRK